MTLGLKRDLFDTAVKDLLKSGAIDENDAKRFLKTLVGFVKDQIDQEQDGLETATPTGADFARTHCRDFCVGRLIGRLGVSEKTAQLIFQSFWP